MSNLVARASAGQVKKLTDMLKPGKQHDVQRELEQFRELDSKRNGILERMKPPASDIVKIDRQPAVPDPAHRPVSVAVPGLTSATARVVAAIWALNIETLLGNGYCGAVVEISRRYADRLPTINLVGTELEQMCIPIDDREWHRALVQRSGIMLTDLFQNPFARKETPYLLDRNDTTRFMEYGQASVDLIASYAKLIAHTFHLRVALRLFDPQFAFMPRLDQEIKRFEDEIARGIEVPREVRRINPKALDQKDVIRYAEALSRAVDEGRADVSQVLEFIVSITCQDKAEELDGLYREVSASRAPSRANGENDAAGCQSDRSGTTPQGDTVLAKVLAKLRGQAIIAGTSQEFDEEDIAACTAAFDEELRDAGRFGEGVKKITEVLELTGEHGLDLDTAIYLVGSGLDERTIALHCEAETAFNFELNGIDHKVLTLGFSALDQSGQQELVKNLDAFVGWIRLMPGSGPMNDEECVALSAVLAASGVTPPGRRAEVSAALAQPDKEDKVLECILSAPEGMQDRLTADFSRYQTWTDRFKPTGPLVPAMPVPAVANGHDNAHNGDCKSRTPQAVPHTALVFPRTVVDAIKDAGLSVTDVKFALVYGLRLTSGKGACGGKYFPTEAFRNNCRRDFNTGTSAKGQRGRDASVDVRVKNTEKFLLHQGVISTYGVGGHRIRLNVKQDPHCTSTTPIGDQILTATIKWRAEFLNKGMIISGKAE